MLLLAGCTLDVVFPDGVGADTDSGAPDTADTDSGPPDTADTDSGDTAGAVRTAARPVAPTAATPMWQGLQEAFVDADGAACTVPVAASLGGSAFCFVAEGEALHCAGLVYSEVYGSAFTPTGLGGARQVLVSPTIDAPDGNAVCVVADGVLQCFGARNTFGQLGVGDIGPVETFTSWGLTGVTAAATGTWDQVCARDGAGEVWCAGNGIGATPVSEGVHGHVVLDTVGGRHFDDPDRWRASAGRSECVVGADGLTCGVTPESGIPSPLGEPGHVVDGGLRGMDAACWLEDDGRAWCVDALATTPVFDAQPVLLLALDNYTDGACALYADGSIACVGDNPEGRFGSGGTDDLAVETIVAPPGTVDTRCR